MGTAVQASKQTSVHITHSYTCTETLLSELEYKVNMVNVIIVHTEYIVI